MSKGVTNQLLEKERREPQNVRSEVKQKTERIPYEAGRGR